MSQSAFLSVRGIKKSFGSVKVLHGIDLDLYPGSVTALLGENGAGKSTFVRILAGDHQPDEGTIKIDEDEVSLRTVAQSRNAGIRLIAQEIADAPSLTVAENITLGSLPNKYGFISRQKIYDDALVALQALGADLPLKVPVSSLRLGERQIVEIARATAGSSRCLIFDEPTAALSDVETKRLFKLIKYMQEQGKAILYITHRLDEVFAIADRVCVLRDGRVSLESPISEIDQARVVTSMVGHTMAENHKKYVYSQTDSKNLVSVRNLTSEHFKGINIDLAPGEIVGIYGKIGSGVPELAGAIFGVTPYSSGEIFVEGKSVRFHHPQDAIAHGFGFLPADRASEGLLKSRSVAENLAAPNWRSLARLGFMSRAIEVAAFTRWHKILKIRSRPEGSERITTLSGGNQQKVLLGRWLEAQSKILLLVEPTRGVDIGARQEIYQVLRDLAKAGHSILIASSDYEDITESATRAIVMLRGQIVAHLTQNEISTARLTEAAGGGAYA